MSPTLRGMRRFELTDNGRPFNFTATATNA